MINLWPVPKTTVALVFSNLCSYCVESLWEGELLLFLHLFSFVPYYACYLQLRLDLEVSDTLEIMTTHVNSCPYSFAFGTVFLENVFQSLSGCRCLGRVIYEPCFCWKLWNFFIWECKEEIIRFFFFFARLYRWTITVVLALTQSWAWTFIMLEKKNQGNSIAGNPGKPGVKGDLWYCITSNLHYDW